MSERRRSYSVDLRLRVIEHIKEGNKQKSSSILFKVSSSTVNRWWVKYQERGEVSPKARGGSKGKIDLKALEEFMESNGDKRLVDISKHFKASIWGICKRLKQLGYRYKKKPIPMWKRIKLKETYI
jgi:transposase